MTIGLTWRRTARRIKRLKETVSIISRDYLDRSTPELLAALQRCTLNRSWLFANPAVPLNNGSRAARRFAKLQESEAVTPFKKVNPSHASCSGDSANLRQMQQSLGIFLKLASKNSIVTTI